MKKAIKKMPDMGIKMSKTLHAKGIVGAVTLDRFKNEPDIEQLSLETMMMFNTIQGDVIARELNDYASKEQKLYLKNFLQKTRGIVQSFEKHFGFDAGEEEEKEEAYYYCLEFIRYTTLQMMKAMKNDTTEQFKQSIKHF